MSLNYVVNVGFKVDASALKALQSQFGTVTTATKAQTAATQQATAANNAYTMSAKAQANALRMVPAQITDIFVGLSTGQKPLTVLLQQGGQLKDMFNGIVPALKAVGESVLGFINPFTIAAAAIGAVAYALYDGEQKLKAFEKALITTGSASGVTAGDLQSLANSIASTTKGITNGDISAALAQVTSSGQITGEQLGLVSKAAVQMQQLTGQSIDTTVQQFVSLSQDPIAALTKLNETQHFVTVQTYETVKSLMDQGDQLDAVKVLFNAYADAIDHRTQETTKNIGFFASAWQAVKKAMSDADVKVNELVGNGDKRKELIDKALELQAAQQQLKQMKEHPGFFDNKEAIANEQAYVDKLQKEHDALYNLVKAKDDKAKADETDATVSQYLMTSDNEYTSVLATNSVKRKKALETEQASYKAAMKAAGNDIDNILRVEEAHAKAVAAIQEKYKDPKKPKGPKDPEIAAFATFQSQVDSLRNNAITTDDTALTKYEQGIAKLSQELNVYMQKSGDATKGAELFNEGQKALMATLEKARKAEKDANDAFDAAYASKNAALKNQIDDQIASIGLGAKEAQRAHEVAQAYRDEADELARLALQRQENKITEEQYQHDVNTVKSSTEEKVKIMQQGYSDMDNAQANWINGASAAWQNFKDQALDVAGQTQQAFANAFEGLADSLTNAAMTGKLTFANFTRALIADLIKIETRILISKALMAIFGGAGSYTAGSASSFSIGGGGTYTGSGSMATSWPGMANGGAFYKGSQFFADGAIVNRATSFGMANGYQGVMGEAGPEAILPLKRKNGKLGLDAEGLSGGSTNVNTFAPVININANGGSEKDSKETAALVQRVIKEQWNKWLQDQMRSGNMLNPGFKNRYY